jgi:xanthine dehydrogenase YagR molybdenum-binding subunit
MERIMSITRYGIDDIALSRETRVVGKELPRTEARQKAAGNIAYTADITVENVAYGVLISSPIAKGRIIVVDTSAAQSIPGVLRVFTHETMPRLASHPEQPDWEIMYGSGFVPMEGPDIFYAGQPIGYVVAETLEAAEHAAERVQFTFEQETPAIDWDPGTFRERRSIEAAQADSDSTPYHVPDQIWLGYLAGFLPGRVVRGEGKAPLDKAEVRLDGSWTLSYNHHNPMELVATTAVWDGRDRLLAYDTSQSVTNFRNGYAKLLGLPRENVRVRSSYVGGGFGCKGPIWPHSWLTALAAREIGRPVRLILSRAQMYASVGHREAQQIELALGASRDGQISVMHMIKYSPTPAFEDWAEPSWYPLTFMYDVPHLEAETRLVPVNTMSPTFMRAPGEAPGAVVQECALNELAANIGVDPIELRLRNHADIYPVDGSPWSSKRLKECYARGAELVGWTERKAMPRCMRDGYWLLGMGMASASHTVYRLPSMARVTLSTDGSAHVAAGATDIGTGSATFMRQIVAEEFGLSFERVSALIGDTMLPEAPMQAGASLSASLGSATLDAAHKVKARLISVATQDPASPLHGLSPQQLLFDDGHLVAVEGNRGEAIATILRRAGFSELSADGRFDPGRLGEVRTGDPERDKREGHRSMHSWGAIFAAVAVDPDLGLVRVRRLTGVYACGRILNPKLARNQLIGGITWGMSQALFEESHMDRRHGRFVNANLAEYLIPVNADVPTIEVHFLDDPDPFINPAGVKGVGEIGIVGVAAAIVDAVWHATGKRLRKLPITAETIL